MTCPKSNLENDNVQAFDTKWHKVLSAVTDRPLDSTKKSLHRMHPVCTYCRSVLRRRHSAKRNTTGQEKIDGSKGSWSRTQRFLTSKRGREMTTHLLHERQPKEKRTARAETKVPKEEIVYVGPRKANVLMEIRAPSSTIPKRKTKEEVEIDHILRRAPHTQIQKRDRKGKRGCRTNSDWKKSFWETRQTTLSRFQYKNWSQYFVDNDDNIKKRDSSPSLHMMN